MMTLEDLYNMEKARIRKLAFRYSRVFGAEPEDLEQTGALAICEAYNKYARKVSDEILLWLSRRIVNRMMYKYALDEFKHKKVIFKRNAKRIRRAK